MRVVQCLWQSYIMLALVVRVFDATGQEDEFLHKIVNLMFSSCINVVNFVTNMTSGR